MIQLNTAQKVIAKVWTHQIVCIEDEAANAVNWIIWFANQIYRHDQKPFYTYNMAEGMRRFGEVGDPSSASRVKLGFAETDIFDKPELGVDPVTYYLDQFVKFKDDGIFVFQDLHKSIVDPRTGTYDPLIVSYLRTIASDSEIDTHYTKRLIFLGQKIELPDELIRLIPIVNFPLPNLRTREAAVSQSILTSGTIENIDKNLIAEAASGLTVTEISAQIKNCHQNASMVGANFDTPNILAHVIDYKTRLLERLKVQVYPTSNAQFGGHEILKDWLDEAYLMMQPEIAEYGLPKYKGMLLAGVSGCGKTLIAKSIASSWNLPLIKLNLGELKGRYVGESEQNLKKALSLIGYLEGVLLIDEVEKTTAGSNSDSTGVSTNMLSQLLDYMNEQSKQFVVLTANNVAQIPSELLRSGRINERWFVDLPGKKSRREILDIHLFSDPRRIKTEHRPQLEEELAELVDRTKGYSGAEIEEISLRGLRRAIRMNRPQRPLLKDFMFDLPVPLNRSHQQQHQKISEYKKYARTTSKDLD